MGRQAASTPTFPVSPRVPQTTPGLGSPWSPEPWACLSDPPSCLLCRGRSSHWVPRPRACHVPLCSPALLSVGPEWLHLPRPPPPGGPRGLPGHPLPRDSERVTGTHGRGRGPSSSAAAPPRGRTGGSTRRRSRRGRWGSGTGPGRRRPRTHRRPRARCTGRRPGPAGCGGRGPPGSTASAHGLWARLSGAPSSRRFLPRPPASCSATEPACPTPGGLCWALGGTPTLCPPPQERGRPCPWRQLQQEGRAHPPWSSPWRNFLLPRPWPQPDQRAGGTATPSPDLRLGVLLVEGGPELSGHVQRRGPPSSSTGLPEAPTLGRTVGGVCISTRRWAFAHTGQHALSGVCREGGSVWVQRVHLQSGGRVLGCPGSRRPSSPGHQGPNPGSLRPSPPPRLPQPWAGLTASVQLSAGPGWGSWHCSVGPSSFCRFPNCSGVSLASGGRAPCGAARGRLPSPGPPPPTCFLPGAPAPRLPAQPPLATRTP